jgi:hypothetical protein
MLKEHDGKLCKTYHGKGAETASTLEELARELYLGDSKNLRNVGNRAQITRCHYPNAGFTNEKFSGNIFLRNSALKLVM